MMETIRKLIEKGVRMPAPGSVEIGTEVDAERISGDGVVIHAGCKLFGRKTLIGDGSRLGYEGPVTVENCRIGPGVELRGGYFRGAVFLEKSACGSGAHVREGTILEEQASIAHAVGLKHTILFPFVTLGSLINFCDCLMAGGTDRRNHSEVGSSYIHFNYTPSQDKATPSLFGDVPRGVMLNQDPIFLGGQGGAVGPVRLNFGITVAAGTIVRKDEKRPNRLIFGGAGKGGNIAFTPGKLSNTGRILENNWVYIANLLALRQWHLRVRSLFVSRRFPEALLEGLMENLGAAIDERIKQLDNFIKKQDGPSSERIWNCWPAVEAALRAQRDNPGEDRLREEFLEQVNRRIYEHGKDYLTVIRALAETEVAGGTRWLEGIVEQAAAEARRACGDLNTREEA
jgi:UDP-N-acetylglucosamine/UDP-N-acetylgalactosamine diphosphorylase